MNHLTPRIREFSAGRAVGFVGFGILASISIFCFRQSRQAPAEAARVEQLSQLFPGTGQSAPAKYRTKPIREARVGDRILADNPEGPTPDEAGDIDPAQWRYLTLSLTKPAGDRLEMELRTVSRPIYA